MNIDHCLHEWHVILENKDVKRLKAALAEDATMISPVVHTPQVGKAITLQYLTAALHVFANENFKYVRECTNENSAVLEFETKIGETYINGVDMITWNDKSKIIEFRVMVRPLQALNLIHKMMGEMLATPVGAE